jgi:alpha,alpha-trehalase
VHDRAVRESGHDTTYHFEKECAYLATIDLNALLYKYEVDIATAIQTVGEELSLQEDFALSPFPPTPGSVSGVERSLSRVQTVDEWLARKDWREGRINKYLWNEGKKFYFDWDTVANVQMPYGSVTAFWALWAGCASDQQAYDVMIEDIKKFEVIGGLVSGTEESRGRISLDRPNRQWDFPRVNI